MAIKTFEELAEYLLANIINATKVPADTLAEYLQDLCDTLEFNVDDFTESFKGIATTATNPGTPSTRVFYLCDGPGVYTHFGNTTVTEEFAFLAWNGSSWTLSEQNITVDMALYAKKTMDADLNANSHKITNITSDLTADGNAVTVVDYNKLPYYNSELLKVGIPLTNVVHMNPAADYAANTNYSTYGLGLCQLMTRDVHFKALKVKFYGFAADIIAQVKVFKHSANWASGDPPGTQLGTTVTLTYVQTDTAGYQTITLDGYYKISKGEYLVVAFYKVSGSNVIEQKNWSTDGGGARLSAHYNLNSGLWNSGTWSTYQYSCPVIFLTDQPDDTEFGYVKGLTSPLQTQLNARAVIGSDGGMKNSYLSEDRWKHSRGDAEYAGDDSYSLAGYSLGVWDTVTNDAAFNKLNLKIFAGDSTHSVEIRVYKNESGAVITNPSSVLLTLLETFTVTDLSTSTNPDLYTLNFTDYHLVLSGTIIQVFMVASVSQVGIRKWNALYGGSPERHGFHLTNSGTPWSVAWSTASGAPYLSTPLLLQADRAVTLSDIAGKAAIPTPRMVMPSNIYIATGRELNIWYDALALNLPGSKPSSFRSVFSGASLGASKDECFRFAPATNANYTLTFYALDDNGTLLQTKSAAVKAVLKTAGGGATKRLLFIGDSLMSVGDITQEILTLAAADGGMTPELLGTQGTTPNFHEGRAGWGWVDFATNPVARVAYKFTVSGVSVNPGIGSTYTNNSSTWTIQEVSISGGSGYVIGLRTTGSNTPTASGNLVKASGTGDSTIAFNPSALNSGNPFWDYANSNINFQRYCGVQGYSSGIDFCCIMLGINDMGFGTAELTSAQITTVINYVKTIVTAMASGTYGYPNCKIIVALPTLSANNISAFGANYYSGYWDNYLKSMRSFWEALIANFDTSIYDADTSICPVGLFVDRKYGYPNSTEVRSARESTTQFVNTNYVHLSASGYLQAADAFYSHIKGLL